MNVMDAFFLILFVGFLALGFFQGMIRLAVLLLAFYLSLVLASLYYSALGMFFQQNFGARSDVGEYVGFGLIMLFGFFALAAAGIYTFRYAKVPGGLEYLDRIGGVLLSLLLAALFIGIFSTLLWNLMILRGGRNIDLPLMGMLGNSVSGSFLLRYFADIILPQVYNYFDPILPNSARFIFIVRN
jgi:uncharacterized membrane protein required for colicin V production